MEASPSAPVATKVHAVSVLNPPLTRSTSCSFNSRAPRRVSTLLLPSYILFSFRHFGSRFERAQTRWKLPMASRDDPRTAGLLLNEAGIFVCITASVAVAGTGDSCGSHDGSADIGMGLHSRANKIDLVYGQFAGARACEHSVVFLLRHAFLLSVRYIRWTARDLRTLRVLIRAALGQVSKRQAAGRAAGAYFFQFFQCQVASAQTVEHSILPIHATIGSEWEPFIFVRHV